MADIGGFRFGLFLFPEETKYFPHVDPMWGFGLKGRSRPRPKTIKIYQYPGNTCPHLNNKNLCDIYGYHPIGCKTHPLSMINLLETSEINVTMSRLCPWTEKIAGHKLKLSDVFPEDILKANVQFNNRLARTMQGANPWLFDLRTKRWHRATEQMLGRISI